jgi:hypothetical protein
MHPFEEYLKRQNLEALAVSVRARVRYMIVYKAMKGNPIAPQHAAQIKHAVLTLTGVPFTGNLVLTESPSVQELPTLPLRRIPEHQR